MQIPSEGRLGMRWYPAAASEVKAEPPSHLTNMIMLCMGSSFS